MSDTKTTKEDESEQIDSFFTIERAVYNLFGYNDARLLLPLVDYRNLYWGIGKNEDDSMSVLYSRERSLTQEMLLDKEFESFEIALVGPAQSVYPKLHFTLVCLDAERELGGASKRLGIFDNAKKTELSFSSVEEAGTQQ